MYDVIHVLKRIFLVISQPQIVCDGYSLRNRRAEFLSIPKLRRLCRGKIIGDHPVPRISHTSELVKLSELVTPERFSILGKRRVLLEVVPWITQTKPLDPVLLLA